MARIKDASVDAVKAAADIVEVVSLRTSLRRVSGARFSGRCPFHEEKTPSFSVDPVGKLYYCFGCGKGGDVIRFVQESENLDFAGALEWLAERFRDTLVHDLVETSEAAGDIAQSEAIGEGMLSLRSFMFDRVYLGPQVKPEHRRAEHVVRTIFGRLCEEPDRLPPGDGPLDERITDYLAGMTDRFALTYAEALE